MRRQHYKTAFFQRKKTILVEGSRLSWRIFWKSTKAEQGVPARGRKRSISEAGEAGASQDAFHPLSVWEVPRRVRGPAPLAAAPEGALRAQVPVAVAGAVPWQDQRVGR